MGGEGGTCDQSSRGMPAQPACSSTALHALCSHSSIAAGCGAHHWQLTPLASRIEGKNPMTSENTPNCACPLAERARKRGPLQQSAPAAFACILRMLPRTRPLTGQNVIGQPVTSQYVAACCRGLGGKHPLGILGELTHGMQRKCGAPRARTHRLNLGRCGLRGDLAAISAPSTAGGSALRTGPPGGCRTGCRGPWRP